MKILVTGGAGFIGSHLCERLISEGHSVDCVDIFDNFYSPEEKRNNIYALLLDNNFRCHEIDIIDKNGILNLFKHTRPDKVIHLAANAGVRPSILNPSGYFRTNLDGTLSILEASVQYKPEQIIFASSSSVYGTNKSVPFNESDPTLLPASPYAASKIAAEALCATYSSLYELSIVALRFFTVFGKRQRPDLAIRKFIELILNEKEIEVFGDGTTARDYTHYSDIVDGIMRSLNYDKEKYSVFNLGNSYPVKLIDLVKTIEEKCAKSAKLKFSDLQAGDVPITFADITKARNLLGYEPKVKIDQGVEEMVSWIKQKINY